MLTCKECGFTSNRLQWTHFKFNCTGRFTNGKEYQAAYPGELLVDPSLAKTTAVTLDNLKKKYGEVEGESRWAQYKSKQSASNTLEYKQEKFGWSEEDFRKFNASRAVTIENMIARHGEVAGLEKWQAYCDAQRYTKTKEYLIKKYGKEAGEQKFITINKAKAASHDPKSVAEKLGITIDQAVSIICSRGKTRFTSNLEKEFIKLLQEEIGELDHSTLRNPFGKWCHESDRYMIFDIQHKDCIIEFNGDYWHANPLFYNATDLIRGIPASEIWTKDKKKRSLAEKFGYRVLTVWEHEYNNDKSQVIKDVVAWILNEQK